MGSTIPTTSRSILIVDDQADAADTLALLLGLEGHVVKVARNGLAALEILATFNPDIVLLDIGLPGMSGYEVAMQIRQESKNDKLRLVALTGFGQAEDRRQSLASGFDRHLVKPVSLDSIREAINGSGI